MRRHSVLTLLLFAGCAPKMGWISWFVTAGAFDDSTTGRAEDDPTAWTENAWQSPGAAETAFLWLVLHDSRGGIDFTAYTLTVAL